MILFFLLYFQYNNQLITWKQLVRLANENQPVQQGTTMQLGILNRLPKITPQHIYLTPSLRMKVKLATQVFAYNDLRNQ